MPSEPTRSPRPTRPTPPVPPSLTAQRGQAGSAGWTAAAAPSFALTNSGNITVSPGATNGDTSTISVTPSVTYWNRCPDLRHCTNCRGRSGSLCAFSSFSHYQQCNGRYICAHPHNDSGNHRGFGPSESWWNSLVCGRRHHPSLRSAPRDAGTPQAFAADARCDRPVCIPSRRICELRWWRRLWQKRQRRRRRHQRSRDDSWKLYRHRHGHIRSDDKNHHGYLDCELGQGRFSDHDLDSLFLTSMTSTDVMIEYGPVEIGGKTDYCPVKSVSIVKAAVEASLDASERPRTMDFSAAGSPHWTGGRSQAVNSRFAPQQTYWMTSRLRSITCSARNHESCGMRTRRHTSATVRRPSVWPSQILRLPSRP